MDDIRGDVDRISSMPDCILDKILGYCSPKQVAQTSVLSKRWCDVYISYPYFDHFRNICEIVVKESSEDSEEDSDEEDSEESLVSFRKKLENFDKFITFKLHRLQDNKLPLKRFWLGLDFGCNWLPSWLDTWLELVDTSNLEEFKLQVLVYDTELIYELPESIYSASAITILHLNGCHFKCASISLYSLRKLSFRHVKIDEDTIGLLNSSCPLIESFDFAYCVGFNKLEICGLRMLKRFSYCSDEIFKVCIDAPNLESLFYSYGGELPSETSLPSESYPVSLSRCKDLRKLDLEGVCASTKYLENYLSSSCLMELYLLECLIIDEIMISNNSLRIVEISRCRNFVEATFDTPNLTSFIYEGKLMPKLSSMNGFGSWVARLQCTSPLNADWFRNLARFIVVPHKFQALNLRILSKLDISPDDIPSFSLPHIIQMEKLELFCPSNVPLSFEALLDGLFCNIRPRILKIQAAPKWKNELEELHKQLLDENRSCCSSSPTKCWRHFLKEATTVPSREVIRGSLQLALYELNWSTSA